MREARRAELAPGRPVLEISERAKRVSALGFSLRVICGYVAAGIVAFRLPGGYPGCTYTYENIIRQLTGISEC